MTEKIKTRQSNFEVMRIISMIMIVMWHLIFHGNLMDTTTGTTKFILELLVLIGAVHVNSFIIVTGYFQCEKRFSIKKVFSLMGSVWFYKVLFLIVAIVIGFSVTRLEILQELMPIDIRDYWFINCYILLYFISPYLNILINKMKQQQHRKLIIGGMILFCIIPMITNQGSVQNNGYTIVNFCYLYLVGAYLKKYPLKENLHFINYSKNKRQCIYLFVAVSACFLNFIFYQFSKSLISMDNSLLSEIGKNFLLSWRSFSNPLIIIQSIFYFLFFSTLTIKSKKINVLSKYVLDVYLIHENYYMLNVIYIWMLTSTWYKLNGYLVIALTIITPIIIFFICIIISVLKNILFKFITSRMVWKKTSNRIYKYLNDF